MSTDDVKFNSKKMEKMNKLPKGEFFNVRFDIDESGFNQYCYSQCKLQGDALDCTKGCSGYDSCLDALRDIDSSFPDFGILQDGCKNMNGINKDSDPSTYDNIQTNIMNNYGGGGCSIM